MAMATVTTPQPANETPGSDPRVVRRGVGWEGYSSALEARGDKKYPRMVYLDGDLYLMSPAYRHENSAIRLGYFVMVVVEELDIPCIPARATTFRDRPKKGGAEGDETFYLTNVPRIRGRRDDDLKLPEDPPPDLVVEAVNTHDADEAIEVWRRFGVPEIWVQEKDRLLILVLQTDGRYEPSDSSAAFPFLKASEIQEWVNKPQGDSETSWIKELRQWVAGTLVERRRLEAERGA